MSALWSACWNHRYVGCTSLRDIVVSKLNVPLAYLDEWPSILLMEYGVVIVLPLHLHSGRVLFDLWYGVSSTYWHVSVTVALV